MFNVHVNRVPYDGRVKEIDYYPGKFFSANLDKASQQNEHNAVSIEMENGQPLCVVQIAGLIARRIICHIKPEDQVRRGQRFGLICFGSRLDVYLSLLRNRFHHSGREGPTRCLKKKSTLPLPGQPVQ